MITGQQRGHWISPQLGRIEVVELPAVELAVAVHPVSPDINVTYGRLGAWVTDHALAVDTFPGPEGDGMGTRSGH